MTMLLTYLRESLTSRGFLDTAKIVFQCLNARWALRHASLDGPVRLRGKARVVNDGGRIVVGGKVRLEGTTLPVELIAHHGGRLSIGIGTYINYGTSIAAHINVAIGEQCSIGQYCIIMDDDYHDINDHSLPGKCSPIEIGDRVWLGARVIVLRGSKIGSGSVIGANSVVTGVIPERVVAAGVPARVIRHLQ